MSTHSFHKIAWLFVITYIIGMFLPRLAVEGMFADGLCYAAIARNMAEGRGSLWEPFFSTSFWLPYNTGSVFYENLPLTFWLQSWFFKIFGDHWWTERIYCTILLVGTSFLIVKVWQKTVPQQDKAYAWLPLFLWYGFPRVIWASPYNQLDYTEGFFSLMAVYFLIPTQNTLPKANLVIAGIITFVAFLTKGPVGIFPLSIPIIYWLIFQHQSFSKSLLNTLIITATFGLCFLLLWQYEPAESWLTHYFDQQFVSAITGKRETSGSGWEARLYILPKILIENAPSVSFAILFTVFTKGFLRLKLQNRQNAVFFLFIALAASLPIMISPKQHEIYLLPAFPFYAMATSAFFLPIFKSWAEKYENHKSLVHWKNGLAIILVGVFVYSGWLWGKPGREEDVLADMKRLSPLIPDRTKVGVCPNMMTDFVHHCYFQRYHKWELTTDLSKSNFFLLQPDCDTKFVQNLANEGFTKIKLPTEKYQLYRK